MTLYDNIYCTMSPASTRVCLKEAEELGDYANRSENSLRVLSRGWLAWAEWQRPFWKLWKGSGWGKWVVPVICHLLKGPMCLDIWGLICTVKINFEIMYSEEMMISYSQVSKKPLGGMNGGRRGHKGDKW